MALRWRNKARESIAERESEMENLSEEERKKLCEESEMKKKNEEEKEEEDLNPPLTINTPSGGTYTYPRNAPGSPKPIVKKKLSPLKPSPSSSTPTFTGF